MRLIVILTLASFIFFCSCNENKVYQEFVDFDDRYWLVYDTAKFQFSIEDTLSNYDVFCNIRNATTYPYSRIFLNVAIADTMGSEVHTAMVSEFLFEPKSGKPFGKSGLGDLYDHQISILKNYKFTTRGPYVVTIGQQMRTDTLSGIISVGLGIDKRD